MNDTILNSRQEKILELLKNNGKLSRPELTGLISLHKPVSRITLIRDINALIKAGLIHTEGKGRSTSYYTPITNPLLEYIDIDSYFNKEENSRNAKNNFNVNVFDNLTNLFTNEEIAEWTRASEEFKKRITHLDKSIYKRELERFIIEFSWKSAQIEGNTYDLLETETLLTQNIEAKGHSKEEAIMLINHKNAFDIILENKDSFTNLNFADIIQLHEALTKRLVTSGIRKQPVRITGTYYTPPSLSVDLENYLRKTIKLINHSDFPPQKAMVASVMIAYIQPFSDGNKRTARTLSNAILLAHDFFPLSYRNVDVNEYRKALILFYEQNNLYHFKKIFFEQLEFALNNYFKIK
jgi:Fic family protein